MPHRDGDEVLALVRQKLGEPVLEARLNLGDAEIRIARDSLLEVFALLKQDKELHFDMLISVTAVDYLDSSFVPRSQEGRFEVVYHLLSLEHLHRLRVKVSLPEEDPSIESLCGLWPGANFMEREAFDMLGIVFKNHPDLRRILMYDEFQGHPLRKDYPLRKKQPRIPLRYPEVRNTAKDMQRPELVAIRKRQAHGELKS